MFYQIYIKILELLFWFLFSFKNMKLVLRVAYGIGLPKNCGTGQDIEIVGPCGLGRG